MAEVAAPRSHYFASSAFQLLDPCELVLHMHPVIATRVRHPLASDGVDRLSGISRQPSRCRSAQRGKDADGPCRDAYFSPEAT